MFKLLYEDENFLAIDKPAGFYVHPPENKKERISSNVNCLYLLKKQLGLPKVYPVHRLDRATAGVTLFAKNPEMLSKLSKLFQYRTVEKTYFGLCRGWIKEPLTIDYALDDRSAQTSLSPLGHLELPHSVGPYPTARYTLLEIQPHTGRFHQIRRHLHHISHPLVGDTVYGDGKHNRFFREHFQDHALWLKAYSLSFHHPETSSPTLIRAFWKHRWLKLFDLMGICPWMPFEIERAHEVSM